MLNSIIVVIIVQYVDFAIAWRHEVSVVVNRVFPDGKASKVTVDRQVKMELMAYLVR